MYLGLGLICFVLAIPLAWSILRESQQPERRGNSRLDRRVIQDPARQQQALPERRGNPPERRQGDPAADRMRRARRRLIILAGLACLGLFAGMADQIVDIPGLDSIPRDPLMIGLAAAGIALLGLGFGLFRPKPVTIPQKHRDDALPILAASRRLNGITLRPGMVTVAIRLLLCLAFATLGLAARQPSQLWVDLVALYFLGKLLPGSTALTLDRDGFTTTRFFLRHFTHWQDIQEVAMWRNRFGQRLPCYHLNQADQYFARARRCFFYQSGLYNSYRITEQYGISGLTLLAAMTTLHHEAQSRVGSIPTA